jgi:hypothetical protein
MNNTMTPEENTAKLTALLIDTFQNIYLQEPKEKDLEGIKEIIAYIYEVIGTH